MLQKMRSLLCICGIHLFENKGQAYPQYFCNSDYHGRQEWSGSFVTIIVDHGDKQLGERTHWNFFFYVQVWPFSYGAAVAKDFFPWNVAKRNTFHFFMCRAFQLFSCMCSLLILLNQKTLKSIGQCKRISIVVLFSSECQSKPKKKGATISIPLINNSTRPSHHLTFADSIFLPPLL